MCTDVIHKVEIDKLFPRLLVQQDCINLYYKGINDLIYQLMCKYWVNTNKISINFVIINDTNLFIDQSYYVNGYS